MSQSHSSSRPEGEIWLAWRVILSKAKDPFLMDRSLSMFGTTLRVGFLSRSWSGIEMTRL